MGTGLAWLMVAGAGLLEMVWSYSAKRADGWQNLGWGGVTIVASLISFLLLTFATKVLPLGTAYVAWTGIGAVGSLVVGITLLNEPAGFWRLASAGLVVLGVVGMRLTDGK